MTPARASLLLLTAIAPLALVACDTVKKPIRGFDKQPPGSILLDNLASGGTGSIKLVPIFDLPLEPQQIFRARLNGQDAVIRTSEEEGFYDYEMLYLQGWTGGWPRAIRGVPPGSYVVELVDGSGRSWGQSAPLTVLALANVFSPGVQIPGVVFANFDGKVASWNMVDEDVVVERCLIASGSPTACVPVGTVAPGADLHTVETVAGSSEDDHQALLVRLASDGSQAYQRDLDEGSGDHFEPVYCQIERIIVHGRRSENRSTLTGPAAVAVSSCYDYQSGPP
jgi:hypothetical protein